MKNDLKPLTPRHKLRTGHEKKRAQQVLRHKTARRAAAKLKRELQ